MSLPFFLADGCPTIPAAVKHAVTLLATPGQVIILTGDEGYHAVTVKRIQVGEHIVIATGCGPAAEVEVTATSGKNQLVATVVNPLDDSSLITRVRTVVVQGLPKHERSDTAIENLTQFGVDGIIPWQAGRSIAQWKGNKQAKAQEKWQQTACEAAKQSRRPLHPEVHELRTSRQLAELITRITDDGGQVYVLHEDGTEKLSRSVTHAAEQLHQRAAARPAELRPRQAGSPCPPELYDVMVIIGPEGGISDEEVDMFRNAGAKICVLGEEILRTATAGAAALATLHVALGRW